MRVLYYIEIMHHPNEMKGDGDLNEKLGKKKTALYIKMLKDFWQEVEKVLRDLIPSFHGVHIYQDSFLKMHRKFLEKYFQRLLRSCKSPNFILIKKFMEEGAILEGVEAADVLYNYQRLVHSGFASLHRSYSEMYTDLRDHIIAGGISETLPKDGIGILFIGCGHGTDVHLQKKASDIRVVKPIKLPRQEMEDLFKT